MPAATRSSRRVATRRGSVLSEELNDESERVEYSGEDEYDDEQSVEAEHDDGTGTNRRRSSRQRKPTSKATEATIERIASTRKRNQSNKIANSDAESGYDDNYESEEGKKAKGSKEDVSGIKKGRRSPTDRESDSKGDDNSIRNPPLNKIGGKSRHNNRKTGLKSGKSSNDAKKWELDYDLDHSEKLDSSESTQHDKLDSEKTNSLLNDKSSNQPIAEDGVEANNDRVDAIADQTSKLPVVENESIGEDGVVAKRSNVNEILDRKLKSDDNDQIQEKRVEPGISTVEEKSIIISNKGEGKILDQNVLSNENDPTEVDGVPDCTLNETLDQNLKSHEHERVAGKATLEEHVEGGIETDNSRLDEIADQNVKSKEFKETQQDAKQIDSIIDKPKIKKYDTGAITPPEHSKDVLDEGKVDAKKTDDADSSDCENEKLPTEEDGNDTNLSQREIENDNPQTEEQFEVDTKPREETSENLSSNNDTVVEQHLSYREDDAIVPRPESIKEKNDSNEEKEQTSTKEPSSSLGLTGPTKLKDKGIEIIGSPDATESTEALKLSVAASPSVTRVLSVSGEAEVEGDRVSTGSKRRSKRDKDRSLITSEISESDNTDVDNYVDALQTYDIAPEQRKVTLPKALDKMDNTLEDESNSLKKRPKSDLSDLNKRVDVVSALESKAVSTSAKTSKKNEAETDITVDRRVGAERIMQVGRSSEEINRFETVSSNKNDKIHPDGESTIKSPTSTDHATVTKNKETLSMTKADGYENSASGDEISQQNQKGVTVSESVPEKNSRPLDAIDQSDTGTEAFKNDESKSRRSEQNSPIDSDLEDPKNNSRTVSDVEDKGKPSDSKSSLLHGTIEGPGLDEELSSLKEKIEASSLDDGRTDAKIKRKSPWDKNPWTSGSERSYEYSDSNPGIQADPLKNKSIKSSSQIQNPTSSHELNTYLPNKDCASSVGSPDLGSTNDEAIKLQSSNQEVRSIDESSASNLVTKIRFETKTNNPDVSLGQRKLELKRTSQNVEKAEFKPILKAEVPLDDIKQDKSDSVLQSSKRKKSGPDISERPPKKARIQLENMKLIIFAAGRRVHNGPGYERLFAEYWDAVSSRIRGNLSTSQMHRNRFVINTFLKSKILRKIHNQFILGIIARCFQPIVKSEVTTLAPDAWLPRIKILKPPANEASQPLDFELKKEIDESPITANPTPYHMPLYQSLRSTCFPPEKQQSSAQLRIPGAIVVDPLFRSFASNDGLKVSENAVWLLVIAVKEYTLSLLKGTVGFVKEMKQLDAPSRPVMQPPPASKKRSREPPVAGLKQVDQVTTISAQHIHAFTAATANTIRSRGNHISRTSYERSLHKIDNPSLSLTPNEFIPVKDFLAATIMLPDAKRVKSELSSAFESNVGKSDLSTQARAHTDDPPSPFPIVSSTEVPVSTGGAKSTPKRLSLSSPSQSERTNDRPRQVSSDLHIPEKNHTPSAESPLPVAVQAQANRPKTPTRGGLGRGAKDLASLLARSRTSSGQATPPAVEVNQNNDSKPASVEDVPAPSKTKTSSSKNTSIKVETATGDTSSLSTAAQRRGKGFGLKNLASMMARSVPNKPDEK